MKQWIKDKKQAIISLLVMLSLWFTAMGYTTIACARQLYSGWETMHYNQRIYDRGDDWVLFNDRSFYHDMVWLKLPVFEDFLDVYTDFSHHVDRRFYPVNEDWDLCPVEGEYALLRYYSPSFTWDYDTCYIDLTTVPQALKTWLVENVDEDHENDCYVSMVGYLEGGRFVPVNASFAYADLEEWDEIIMSPKRMPWGEMEWTSIFDQTEANSGQLVRIYTQVGYLHPGLFSVHLMNSATDAVTVEGRTYASLQQLAEAFCRDMFDNNDEDGIYYKESLTEAVFVGMESYLMDAPVEDQEEEYGWCVSVTRCYPLRSAILRLLPIYIITLTLMLAVPVVLGRYRRRKYHRSIQAALKGRAAPDENHGWKELTELEQAYRQTSEQMHHQQQELRRLEKALGYANDAEQNRRQLVSDITHELKTPLAVIHSYAEGLSEGIAPEKREKYLEIIMEEAEKMDTMVLSMLDLSRLEAGKVRLSRDQFCLRDMTKRIFEKLECILEERNLTLHYFGQPLSVIADEGRMEQVVTNLASNAIKYTPEGGNIYVTTKRVEGKAYLAIENECENLSDKALEQIWDSFFREDASRSTMGTGLGLPIAKAIVELHGGTCQAVNTYTGVEFRVTLPDCAALGT